MGIPDPSQSYKQAWIADTVQTAKEQKVNRGDLGREILLSIAGEIGYFKVIALLLLFMLATVGGTLFGAWKLLKRGRG